MPNGLQDECWQQERETADEAEQKHDLSEQQKDKESFQQLARHTSHDI